MIIRQNLHPNDEKLFTTYSNFQDIKQMANAENDGRFLRNANILVEEKDFIILHFLEDNIISKYYYKDIEDIKFLIRG
jgi:tyrosine-protein phosphatase YwqE